MTPADKLIDVYIDHTNRLVPGFLAAARGASAESIDELERLIGIRLPQIYRAFLRRFGENDGTLALGNDASTDVSEMIEFYQEMAASPWLHPSPIAIACGGTVTPEIFMDISVDACPVYFDGWSRFRDLYAASFLGLLHRRTFIEYAVRSHRSHLFLGAPARTTRDRPVLTKLEAAWSAIGLHRMWFSDSFTLVMTGQAGIVQAMQWESGTAGVNVFTRSRTDGLTLAVAAKSLGLAHEDD